MYVYILSVRTKSDNGWHTSLCEMPAYTNFQTCLQAVEAKLERQIQLANRALADRARAHEDYVRNPTLYNAYFRKLETAPTTRNKLVALKHLDSVDTYASYELVYNVYAIYEARIVEHIDRYVISRYKVE